MTGSTTPNHKGILHSGEGRIAKLRMRPMSLYESKDSDGSVSLFKLCNGELEQRMYQNTDITELIGCIIRGGWPAGTDIPVEKASLIAQEYLNAIIYDDIYRMDGIKRDTLKMRLLLRSLARNESTTATTRKLKNDIKEIDDENIDVDSVTTYLDILNACT